MTSKDDAKVMQRLCKDETQIKHSQTREGMPVHINVSRKAKTKTHKNNK